LEKALGRVESNLTSPVPAGATIYLRGGVYGTGVTTADNWFSTYLSGTEANPTVIRSYPGERAIVQWYLRLVGEWITVRDLEFTILNTNRYQRSGGLALNGTGTKAINCLVYNTGTGLAMFNAENNQGGREVYGCLVWGNGYFDVQPGVFDFGNGGWRGNGSAFYSQNKTGIALISDAIAFRNFTTGVNAYSSGSYSDGFHVKGNTLFDHPGGNILTATFDNPIRDQKILNNYAYNGDVVLGYAGGNFNEDLVMTGNIVTGWNQGVAQGSAFTINNWASATIQNNKFYAATVEVFYNPSRNALFSNASYVWNNNSYYGTYQGRQSPQFIYYAGFGGTDVFGPIADWRAATSKDLNSVVGARPTGMEIFVRPNLYERGRAHITIFNWDSANTANINLSATGLTNGQQYSIQDAQNYFGTPILTGTYSESNPTVAITLPGTGSPINAYPGVIETLLQLQSQPQYYTVSAVDIEMRTPKHTPREFNVFVVLPRP